MASEKGPVAAEVPPSLPASAVSQPPIALASNSLEALQADATRATASLKRAREGTPTSPSSPSATQFNPDLSPSKAAKLIGATSRHSPVPLTGAAALAELAEEQRKRDEQYKLQVAGASDNPAFKIQAELMSAAALAVSRPQDAPMAVEEEEAADPATVEIPQPEVADIATRPDVSPNSATSMASLASGPPPVTASPAPMDLDARGADRAVYAPQPQAPMEEKESATSLSYPGILPASAMAAPAPPARGMSLPMTPNAQGGGPRSPNSKKHKCPYCETEFTRHHNLKSHLLTHSQEKPYVCQTCQMRFRRLHDLKRHSKLHTGEKPHECPKCNRKFARGDALARHSKGPGGCVSRRGSLGFGDDDFEGSSQLEGDDTVMSGVVYDGTSDAELTEEDRHRLSLSAVKGTAAGRLYPPNADRAANSSTSNPSMYAQAGMTESPKPLSPSALAAAEGGIARQRSPSLTSQFQQQHYGRHQADRQTPPVPGFAGDGRYAGAAQGAAQGSPAAAQAIGLGAGQPASVSGAAAAAAAAAAQTAAIAGPNGGSGDSTSNNMFASDQGVWAYINSLEESIRELGNRVHVLEQAERTQEEKITQLTTEVTTLRQQLDGRVEVPEAVN